jgi:GT2 family glycosyltransferase
VKRLAVIVLNWNGLNDTLAALDALARCRLPAGWALWTIVVDNGSTDGSVESLSARRDAELIALPHNLRFAGGNNAGLERALAGGAEAIALLNNDTEADAALFERLLLALEQDAGAGVVGPLIYYGPPSDRIWYAGGICRPGIGWTRHRGIGGRDHGQYRAVEPTGYVTGCCLLARREVWEKVGLLDDEYYIYAEDADWCLRARAAGYRLLFVPTARLWHKVSASSGVSSPWKIYHKVRAGLRLCRRHARGPGRITWLPGVLVANAALAAFLLLKGQVAAAAAVPRALADAARGIRAGEAMP